MLGIIVKFIGIVFLLFIGFVLVNHFSSVSEESIIDEGVRIKERKKQSNSIVCILNTNKRKCKIGESPELTVQIINKLDTSITMVGSLDGSEIGFRPPISYYKVRHKLIGKPWRSSKFCATVNPLRIEDFKIVERNQAFNPYEKIDDYGYFRAQQLEGINFYVPGIYELTYHYSTRKKLNGNEVEQVFDSRMKKELIELWDKVPNLELTSNTITIEYNL